MTSIEIPDFVFKMFEQKIVEINTIIVERMCERYKLDKEDACKFMKKELKINFNVVHEDVEQIKIVKKHKKKEDKQTDDNELDTEETSVPKTEDTGNTVKTVNKVNTSSFCEARVFVATDLLVKQCSRSKIPNCNFCKLHQRVLENGGLKYGTINEAKPDCISTEKLNMKVKRTIY
jgi:hypothetical protein